MADAPFSLPQEVGQNPFFPGTAQGAEIVQSGMQWAHSQAALDLQKSQLEEQKRAHDEMTRQFNVKIGSEMHDELSEYIGMKNGPLKKGLLDSFQKKWSDLGYPVDDSLVQLATDNEYAPKLGQLLQTIDKDLRGDQVDLFNDYAANLPKTMREKWSDSMIEKIYAAKESAQMKAAMMGGMVETRQQNSIKAIQDDAKKPVQKHVDNYTDVLNKAHQLNDPNVTNTNVKDVLESISVANAGMGRGNISDSKLKQIIPNLSGTRLTDAIAYLDNNGEQKANPALVKYTKNLASHMLTPLEIQIKALAANQHRSTKYKADWANDAVNSALKDYESGDFFEKTKKEYFPDGTPDWLSPPKQSPKAKEQTGPQTSEVPNKNFEVAAKRYQGMIAQAKTPEQKKKLIQSAKRVLPADVQAKFGFDKAE